MRRHDTDFQISLEIGHVRSNVRKLRVTSKTPAPGVPVNGAQHHVVLPVGCGGESRGDDDSLQFGSMDDERLAEHTEPASLVQKDQSRPLEIVEMNDQREFANPGRRVAARTPREALPHMRIEDERISRRQRTHEESIGLWTQVLHCDKFRAQQSPLAAVRREIVFVEFDQTGDVLQELRGQLLFAKHSGSHRRCDRWLEVRGGVSLPDLPRTVLMESMHKIIEFERIDFTTLPTIELDAKLTQSLAQFTIMRDPRPFSN
jgi:hypothetical protein